MHMLPGLAYIAMNCKDHSLTRLVFFLTQLGFFAYTFTRQLFEYFGQASTTSDNKTCSDDQPEIDECAAPTVSSTVFDKLWWLWLPLDTAMQVCFCIVVFHCCSLFEYMPLTNVLCLSNVNSIIDVLCPPA